MAAVVAAAGEAAEAVTEEVIEIGLHLRTTAEDAADMNGLTLDLTLHVSSFFVMYDYVAISILILMFIGMHCQSNHLLLHHRMCENCQCSTYWCGTQTLLAC